ncbi:hypothetical protein LWI28_023601 [Acer negundo]|uniref:Uncharacterized protein n=1 Tax=Acer negundo TaxID=4023 RepID=A0AAD5J7L1_ACENE|nr:hypothetical protein LWI28_023601 [Acer negundo]
METVLPQDLAEDRSSQMLNDPVHFPDLTPHATQYWYLQKDESSAGNATKKKISGQNNGNGTVKVKEQVKQAKETTKASSKKISDQAITNIDVES